MSWSKVGLFNLKLSADPLFVLHKRTILVCCRFIKFDVIPHDSTIQNISFKMMKKKKIDVMYVTQM